MVESRLSDEQKLELARVRRDRPRKDPRITMQERSDIVNGLWPSLRRPADEPCPFELGEIVHVSSAVAIEVLKITERDDRWGIRYRIIDNRAEPYLASTTPNEVTATDKTKTHWSFEEEHGYSGSANAGLGDAGRAVPRHFQDRISREMSAANALSREQQRLRSQKLATEFELSAACRKGSRSTIRKLKTRLQTLEKRLDHAA